MELPNEDNNGKGSFLCRQTSTRWTPTSDQIRILKDLYYNKNIRSPSADQIQKISAKLKEYGKIEGKNVFYWFQNHKARERQKKRFNTTDHVSMQRSSVSNSAWKVDDKFTDINPGYSPSSSSSNGVFTVGQVGNYGHGSTTMEKRFRDCSISTCGSSSNGANDTLSHNYGWVGIDNISAYNNSPTSYTFFDQKKFMEEIIEEEEEEEEGTFHVGPNIKTLPLFPMHGEEDINGFCNNLKPKPDNYYSGCLYTSDNDRHYSSGSLELSLNSYYTGRSHD